MWFVARCIALCRHIICSHHIVLLISNPRHSKGYYFPVVHKLAVAGIFYFISFIVWTVIDLQIHRVWNERQEQISIWWQLIPLIPVGIAVIQTVPTLDTFVFTLAPTEFKTLGNAINKVRTPGELAWALLIYLHLLLYSTNSYVISLCNTL